MNIFAIILMLMAFPAHTNDPVMPEVRQLYLNAATQERSCEKLMTLLAPYDEKTNPLLTGYRAGATMIMAKYLSNPFKKLSHFNRGRTLLEKAITSDPGNIELHFLRYSIQSNTPAFLGYNDNVDADKKMIEDNLPGVKDNHLKIMIGRYLLEKSGKSQTKQTITTSI